MKRGDPVHALAAGPGQGEGDDAHDAQAQGEEAGRGADHPEHPEQDREQHEGGAQVAAEDDQAGGQQQSRHDRHHRLVQAAEPAVLVGVDVGRPQDQGELGDLRRLDDDRPEGQPVLVAVALHAEERGHQQQRQREEVARPGEPADPPVRQPRRDPRAREPEHHPHQLLGHDVVGVAAVEAVGVHAGGAQHHDQPDRQQQRRGPEQQVVRRERPVERVAQRGVRRAGAVERSGTGRGSGTAGLGVGRRHRWRRPSPVSPAVPATSAPPRRTRRRARRSR